MGEEEANDVATVNYCSTSTAKSRRFVQNPQRNGEKYGSHYCFCNIKAVPTTFSNVVQCTFAFRGYFSSKSPVEPPEATPTQPISISFCKRTNYLFNVHRSIVTSTTIDGPMNYSPFPLQFIRSTTAKITVAASAGSRIIGKLHLADLFKPCHQFKRT